jgi:hypothetical protein
MLSKTIRQRASMDSAEAKATWGDDGVLAVEQGMSGIQRRLGLEHVDARARQVAAVSARRPGPGSPPPAAAALMT